MLALFLVLELFIKLRLGQYTATRGRHRPAPNRTVAECRIDTACIVHGEVMMEKLLTELKKATGRDDTAEQGRKQIQLWIRIHG